MQILEGKTGIVFGVANQHSLAWYIAKALSKAGASLTITYQNERFEKKLQKLVENNLETPPLLLQCDVQNDEEIERVYERIGESSGKLDFVIHCIAHAEREDLENKFIDTSRAGFQTAMETSVYSLMAVTRPAVPLMTNGGSVVTLTYLGSERAVPNYNVMGVAKAALESSVRYMAFDLGEMGIRVNALSPGPLNTLSARGIKGFTNFMGYVRENTALRRNTTGDEVGDAALFLCSDLSSGITGEIIFVDAGYNIKGG